MNKISKVFIFSILWYSLALMLPVDAEVENYQVNNYQGFYQFGSPFISSAGVMSAKQTSPIVLISPQKNSVLGRGIGMLKVSPPLISEVMRTGDQESLITVLDEGYNWFDADFVRGVSIVPVETDEPPSLLSQVLRFLLMWLVVGMLATPFVLRLRMYN